jgi:hypothetical protein
MIDPEPELTRLERFVRRWVFPLFGLALLAMWVVNRYLPLQPGG